MRFRVKDFGFGFRVLGSGLEGRRVGFSVQGLIMLVFVVGATGRGLRFRGWYWLDYGLGWG